MRQILAKIIIIYSDFEGRVIFRSSYTCRYAVSICITPPISAQKIFELTQQKMSC